MLGFFIKYAQKGTRTLKPFGMRPSNARVYQFRHLRENLLQRGNVNLYLFILANNAAKSKPARLKKSPLFKGLLKVIWPE